MKQKKSAPGFLPLYLCTYGWLMFMYSHMIQMKKYSNECFVIFLERSASLLPEYAMPYLIYMLSHLPTHDYTKSSDLGEIKEYVLYYEEGHLYVPLGLEGIDYHERMFKYGLSKLKC